MLGVTLAREEFMRYLLLLVLCSALSAAESVTLDPRNPVDAVKIVDQLTQQTTLPRDQAVALTMAIQTLAVVAEEKVARDKASAEKATKADK